jgi:septal ring factor EnvC (AmiA/AmiB activator)
MLETVLTFLGGGALATILTFILDIRKQNQTSSHTLINDIYNELGRQKAENEQLRREFEEIKRSKRESDDENLELKEENMKLRLEIEDLKKDYEELKAINEELRRKIDILLNK